MRQFPKKKKNLNIKARAVMERKTLTKKGPNSGSQVNQPVELRENIHCDYEYIEYNSYADILCRYLGYFTARSKLSRPTNLIY